MKTTKSQRLVRLETLKYRKSKDINIQHHLSSSFGEDCQASGFAPPPHHTMCHRPSSRICPPHHQPAQLSYL